MTDVGELVLRSMSGEASDAELEGLARWRRESPDHEHEYRQLVRLLQAGRGLPAIDAAGRPAAAAIVARAARGATRRLVRQWLAWGVAAAAVVVVVVQGRWRSTERQAPPQWGVNEIATGANELATVELGDGSVVRLGPSSRLRTHAAGRERNLSLEGRAFFAVAHDPDHPLRVRTPAGEAHVRGTRFELAADTTQLRLRVVEGRVTLSTPRANVDVRAGEETGIRAGMVEPPTRLTATTPVAEWVGTFLAFQATPLRDVAREIERVYHVTVTVSDSTLMTETVTATFTDKPMPAVVNVVCAVLGARCNVRDAQVAIGR